MAVDFKTIPTDDPTIRSLQENVSALAAAIPTAAPVVVTVSGNYQVLGTEDVIHVDAQVAPVRITLRNPATSNRPVTIKQVNLQGSKSKPLAVTLVSPDGSPTIAGAAKYTLDNSGTGSVSITADNQQHWPSATAGGNPPVSPTPAPIPPFVPPTPPLPPPPPVPPTVFEYPVQWAAPGGNNANDGSVNFPKLTAAAAYLALAAGGTVYLGADQSGMGPIWSDGTEAPGLVNGCFLTTGWFTPPPGFLTGKPCKFIGYGPGFLGSQFGQGAVRLPWGKTGSNDRTQAPGVWLASLLVSVTFENVYIAGQQPIRVGWDYLRNTDNSVAWANILTANRISGGQTGVTQFTTDLPPGWSVVQMSRTSNITTIRISAPNVPVPPAIHPNTLIVVNTSNANFANGTYVVIGTNRPTNSTFEYTYSESGANESVQAAVGTLKTNGISPNDMIEILSTNSQFPSTIYRVRQVTSATAFEVDDPFGYSPRSATASGTNIGTYVLEDRQLIQGVDLDQWIQVTTEAAGGAAPEAFNVGPSFDRGSSFVTCKIIDGALQGVTWNPLGGTGTVTASKYLSAGLLAFGGSNGGSNVLMDGTNLEGGNILISSQNEQGWLFKISNVLQDSGSNTARPTIEGEQNFGGGSQQGQVFFENIQLSDAPNSENAPTIQLNGLRCGGSIDGTQYVDAGAANGLTTQPVMLGNGQIWGINSKSIDQLGLIGFWGADGRISGKRVDAQSQFGVYQGTGLVNQVSEDLSTWTTHNLTVTGGFPAPDGTNNAFRLHALASDGLIFPPSFATIPGTQIDDDHYLTGAWFRKSTPGLLPFQSLILGIWGTTIDYCPSLTTPFGGDGEWQWLTAIGTPVVPGNTFTHDNFKVMNGGADYDIAYLRLLYLPAATVSTNEAYRIYSTFRDFPPYLPAGMAGTKAGQKLIAHGGLGVDSTVLVTPSGSASPTKNWPLLDASGTAQGYIPVIPTNSALPAGTVTSVGVVAPIFNSGTATAPVINVAEDGTSIKVAGGVLIRGALGGDVSSTDGSNTIKVIALEETGGPTRLDLGAIPDAGSGFDEVLVRPGGTATVVGRAATAVATTVTKRVYSLQASVGTFTGTAWLFAGGNGFGSTTNVVIEYPNDFIAKHIQISVNFGPTNTIVSGTLSFLATLNGSTIASTTFAYTSASTPGLTTGSTVATGSTVLTDTIGVAFTAPAGYVGGFQTATITVELTT